ncbi:MAG TPA: ISAs1 family transposase [Ktedonobacteraceae bacterium]|nr:ISAs1 family transposase [Ktedonobacteraceae bacterium]
MNLTIFDSVEQNSPLSFSPDPGSLSDAFEQVIDGRKPRGKRYPLALVLTLLLLGKLAGETTIQGVREWVALREKWLREQLDWPRRFPSNATYTRTLASCDAEALASVIAQVMLKARAGGRCGGEEAAKRLRQVAIDGKTLRGTLGHADESQPAVHVLSWYDPHTGLVLAHRAVPHKRNEISTLASWLAPTLVKDRIITADALHTQRASCADVIRFAGHYLLMAKKNQPTLFQDLQTFFTDPQSDAGEWKENHTWNKGHGRLEERRIRTTTLLNPLFEREWSGIGQAFVVRRRVTHRLKCTQQVVYGITSLTPAQASPARLLQLLQTHWHIENRSHYRRDVTLREDASQLRTLGAPLAVAALNGAVLALMDWLQVTNVASQMRRFCARPQEALALLLHPLQR